MPSEKICVFCGADVNGKPRMKDSAGRYACARCAKKAAQKKAQKQAQARSQKPTKPVVAAAEGDDLAQLDEHDILSVEDIDGLDGIAGLEAEALPEDMIAAAPAAVAGGAGPCPECGTPIAPSAKLCVNCGYQPSAGKSSGTKIGKSKEKKEAGSGAGASLIGAAVLGLVACLGLGLALTALGSTVGGWYIDPMLEGRSARKGLYLVSLVVGVASGSAVGIAVAYGAKGAVNAATGVMAAVLAIAAIAGGHAGAAEFVQKQSATSTVIDGEVYDYPLADLQSLAKRTVAVEQLTELMLAGETLRDNEYYPVGYAESIEDFAYPARGLAEDAFAAMAPSEQEERIEREIGIIEGRFVESMPEVYWVLGGMNELADDLTLAGELEVSRRLTHEAEQYAEQEGEEFTGLTEDDLYFRFPSDFSHKDRRTIVTAWNALDESGVRQYRERTTESLREGEELYKAEFPDGLIDEAQIPGGSVSIIPRILIAAFFGAGAAFKTGSSDLIIG